MNKATQLCERVKEIYPAIGECGKEAPVTWSPLEHGWVIQVQEKLFRLNEFLEFLDAAKCVHGDKCVALGRQIERLRKELRKI